MSDQHNMLSDDSVLSGDYTQTQSNRLKRLVYVENWYMPVRVHEQITLENFALYWYINIGKKDYFTKS